MAAQLNPGFAFTDPVAAQQAVQMYQLRLAAEDALRRNAQENIRTFAARDTARDSASQQRALTQSQLAQRDRELAQNQNQFNATQDFRLKSLEANKALAESDMKARRDEDQRRVAERSGLELFNALQSEVSGPNPPTDLEFAARTADVDPQRKEILNRLRQSTISELNRQADVAASIASKWNTRLASVKPENTIERDKILADFEKSKDRNVVELDLASNMFRSLITRPRTDPVYGPEPAPVTPIEDILNRVNQPAVPTGFPGSNSLLDAYRTIAPSWLGGRPNPMMLNLPPEPSVPAQVPVLPPSGYMPQFPR